MTDKNATGNYYTIGHIVQFTGLTDRTIRSYISAGILQGEKINGLWHFTPEQVEALIRDPAVKPSILAKRNAKVYDFLLDAKKTEEQACMILDFPGAEEKALAEYFCYAISNGDFHGIQFSFNSTEGAPRVILKGRTEEVLGLVNGYYGQKA